MSKEKENPVPADLTESLRAAAQRSGLSCAELARQAGVSKPTVWRFLCGDRSITLAVAAKLARVLGLELRRVGKE